MARVFKRTHLSRLGLALLFSIGWAITGWVGVANRLEPALVWSYGAAAWGLAYALAWLHIGSARIAVDDEGITRSSWRGSSRLLWKEIESYAYSGRRVNESMVARGKIGLIKSEGRGLIDTLERWYGDSVRVQYRLRLNHRFTSIDVDSSFSHAGDIVAEVFGHLHSRLVAAAEHDLKTGRSVAFGPVRVTERDLSWNTKTPIALSDIEMVQLYGSSRIRIRIKQRGKRRSYASGTVRSVPDIFSLLSVLGDRGVDCVMTTNFVAPYAVDVGTYARFG